MTRLTEISAAKKAKNLFLDHKTFKSYSEKVNVCYLFTINLNSLKYSQIIINLQTKLKKEFLVLKLIHSHTNSFQGLKDKPLEQNFR